MPAATSPEKRIRALADVLRVPPGGKIDLRKDYDPGFTGDWMGKVEAQETLARGRLLLAEQQDKLYAQDSYSLLIVLQALDAAGKDGTIKHVMSGVNPQGVQVSSFKAPSGEEIDHDYLWRSMVALPRRGNIGIFNRSYYEEVLVVRVHPEFLAGQHLPRALKDKGIWKRRYQEINDFEKYLVNNGTIVLKFFLYVSKEAQKERFLERALMGDKNWKFSAADMRERQRWDEYIDAYQEMFNATSTEWAPWYIVPADHKWFSRLAVAALTYQTLVDLKLAYPDVGQAQKDALEEARVELEMESGGIDDAVRKAYRKAQEAGYDVVLPGEDVAATDDGAAPDKKNDAAKNKGSKGKGKGKGK